MAVDALTVPRGVPLPEFSNGALASLKWLGIVLMVVDHVDAFLFNRELTWACALGRLVFPIFAVVIGYNLARPGVSGDVRYRMVVRLGLFGALALVPHFTLTGGPVLNIFATFLLAVIVVDLIDAGRWPWAVLVFVGGGFLVEYGWPGLSLVVSVWAVYRWRSWDALAWVVWSWLALWWPNGSFLALWAVPVVLLASFFQFDAPRASRFFYWFYPVHLAAFCVALAVW